MCCVSLRRTLVIDYISWFSFPCSWLVFFSLSIECAIDFVCRLRTCDQITIECSIVVIIANFHFCTYKFGSCATEFIICMGAIRMEFIICMGASRIGRRRICCYFEIDVFLSKSSFSFSLILHVLFCLCVNYSFYAVYFFLCRHNISNVSTFMMKTWNSCKKITSFICRSGTSSSLF
jgi:hypothetical protein